MESVLDDFRIHAEYLRRFGDKRPSEVIPSDPHKYPHETINVRGDISDMQIGELRAR